MFKNPKTNKSKKYTLENVLKNLEYAIDNKPANIV